MKKIIIMTMAVMLAAGAYANISFNMWYLDAKDHLGVTISDNTIFKIIVDVNGDGLNSASSLENAFAVGDDQIAFTYAFDATYAGELYMIEGFNNIARPDVATGQKNFYVAWYEGLEDTGAVAPGIGQWFGVYRESNWVFPEDGSTVTFGNIASGTPLNQSNVSYHQVIPEPATALLALIGGGMAWAARRAKRFHNYQS